MEKVNAHAKPNFLMSMNISRSSFAPLVLILPKASHHQQMNDKAAGQQ